MNTVVLEVRSDKDTLAHAARAMKTGRADGTARIAFATPELLWEVLTTKLWELLKVLCGAGRYPSARRPGALDATSRRFMAT